ncbi:hypothetical protein [Flavobacterium fluviale]|uniref:HEAT repeat-containing protein n=1 Tax=Flavobacterium fluviale TaxID=2249356 RepID=A0A344LUV3_9FLAO|nr:hypothetical protein [Flavobacterium fluviale]AXB57695.1 hypothetical protein HYN86_14255 [Flavobacterium fluviale]
MSKILSSLENSLNTNGFRNEYRSLCSNLHQEDIDVDHFIVLLPDIFRQIEKNAMSYQIFDAVNRLCEFLPDKGLEFYSKLKIHENPQLQKLIPSALTGISRSGIAFDKFRETEFLLKNDSQPLKSQGYAFLSTLTKDEIKQSGNFRNFIISLVKSDIESNKAPIHLHIVMALGKLIDIIPEARDYFILLSKSESEDVRFEITRLLSYELDYQTESGLFADILSNLISVPPAQHAVINQLNYSVLPKLIAANPEAIEKFLREWLLADSGRDAQIISFNDTIEQLHEENEAYFRKMITMWLNSNETALHAAVSKMLMELPHYQFENMELDESYLAQLSCLDIQFIVMKIVGYLYFKELIRSSVFSILKARIDDDQCVAFIKHIFNDYVLFNYPSTVEYLEEERKSSSKKVQKAIDEIIEPNKNYFEKINQLDFINEFNPSEKRLKLYNSLYHKEFQSKHKSVSEGKNSFLSMCTTIQLRTGKGMFSKYRGQYTGKTEMAKFQYNAEFPRGEYIDAIGQEKIRTIYRNYKREI